MLGITAAVSVVTTDRDVALVIEQPVEDMQGFACSRRDQFASGIITVMGVDEAGIAAKAAGQEELAVRGLSVEE